MLSFLVKLEQYVDLFGDWHFFKKPTAAAKTLNSLQIVTNSLGTWSFSGLLGQYSTRSIGRF